MVHRCAWCGDDEIYRAYHDDEWGIPLHDDRLLFEFLVLEGAQAGLSWITILKKRENYRKAFESFDCEKVANFSQDDIDRLMGDTGIVRNSRKIKSAIQNARAVIAIKKEYGSFDSYIWSFADDSPQQNEWKSMDEIPAETELSKKMSKDLKKRGFNFVGPTICYAFMQAVGMVNDHTRDCFRYEEIRKIL